MSLSLDSQTKALIWTAKVSARNLRGYVQRLTSEPDNKVESLLRLIASEAEILSKAAEKLGKFDLSSETDQNDAPPAGDNILVLVKTVRAIASGTMTKCSVCGGYFVVSGEIERSELVADDGATARARNHAAEVHEDEP